MASNGKPVATAYDVAIAIATAAEKERLQALRLRFNIPADSPEWQFYAILAPVVEGGRADRNDKTLAAICEQMDRIEQRVDDLAKTPKAALAPARVERPRDPMFLSAVGFLVFALGIFSCSAVAYVAGSILRVPASMDAIVAAFGLGVVAAAIVLGWRWLASIVRR